ncbi:cysteine desulfurase family protein [Caldalkalibacillus mannanilyticus]|uniref:cysteine desulfurase family protein n=1 Tax=Caldalkalibacillus mannanilyticus TaxID=1418 RepID=UPI0004683B81|nr:cysteine desulfurase family protein [Caldalkalibacillus mannanilyticus]
MNQIYVDHAATTPLHPKVLDTMLPFFQAQYGNPSSIHRFGREARAALDQARNRVASALGVQPGTLVFTSGGTEADNMALIGVALANQDRGKHIITTQIEHHAVLHTCQYLEQLGFEVSYLPVDSFGQVKLSSLEQAIREDTILVSIMYGNNEVGTLQPIKEIGELLKDKGIYLHTDAVQAFGIERFDLSEMNVHLVSISSHKINGPKGIGCLYVAPKVLLSPLLFGGSQERKRRAGTENMTGIVGFATAIELALDEIEEKRALYQEFRQRLLSIFTEEGLSYEINGHPEQYLPHILNVSFEGVRTDALLMNLDLAGIAASSGSACTAGSLQPSHVLLAMHDSEERANSAIRFSFGLGNTLEQIEQVGHTLVSIVKRMTSSS